MKITRQDILSKTLSKLFTLGLLVGVGLNACAGPTETPLPFSFISQLPQNEFLFVFVYDDDYTCVDGFCGCPISQAPAMPFEFLGGRLRLNEFFFDTMPTDWIGFRENNDLIALYSTWSQWHAQLQAFSSFPIMTPIGGFSILGVNLQGDIQIMMDGEYVIIPNGSSYMYTSKQPEQINEYCKVLHKYTLSNYGFIKDEDVEFTGAGCCNHGLQQP